MKTGSVDVRGQGLSLHRDLLPDDYILALQGLQDHVAPFPDEAARREVEQALGKSLPELFAEFEVHPMAAAAGFPAPGSYDVLGEKLDGKGFRATAWTAG